MGGIGRGSWQGSNPSITGAGAGAGGGTGTSSAGSSRPSSRGGAAVQAPTMSPASSTGKGATNKVEPDLSTYLNLPLRFTLAPAGSLPQREVTGVLFAYDQATSMAVLCQRAAADSQSNSSKRTFRMYKTQQIKDVTVLSTAPDSATCPSIPSDQQTPVSPQELSARVERAVVEDQRRRARIGPPGTTAEGQAMYDALARTLPVRWHETSIGES